VTRRRGAGNRRRGAGSLARGLAAGLLCLAASPAPAADDAKSPPTLEALMQGMAGTSGVVARFREVKHLALLSEPLESRGTLYFVPPDRLSRETTAPSASRLVIDGDRFSFHDVAGSEAVDLSASPVAREYVSNFIVLFNGDLEELRRRYEPRFTAGEDGRWTLELRPRRRPLRDFIDRVTLEGAGRAMTRMELVEAGGDRTTTWFEEVRTDHVFGAEELARIFSADAPDPAQ
jgi:outer membrane lipoprotein-sorting protein